MNTLIIFFALISVTLALPVDETQVFFAEDTNGNYKLNYASNLATRNEERFANGKVLGSYAFVDTDGIHHEVTYVAAAEEGFIAEGADLPVPVPETFEILQSRAEHLSLVAQEKALNPLEEPEKPVHLEDVLAKLVVPEIAGLPASAVPAEDAENIEAKNVLLHEYDTALRRLSEEYKRVHTL